ncbi:hypothetical protein BDF14DRAFT_1743065 [Spinellus fusiger]|nr:hypothetical protein BDF14DRAFT_1743065 [Spinellus fusiger]
MFLAWICQSPKAPSILLLYAWSLFVSGTQGQRVTITSLAPHPLPTGVVTEITTASTLVITTSGMTADFTGLDLSPLYGSRTYTRSSTSVEPTSTTTVSCLQNCPDQTSSSLVNATANNSGLSTGAIAGIATGVAILFILLIVVILIWALKRRQPKFVPRHKLQAAKERDEEASMPSKLAGTAYDRSSSYSFSMPNASFGYSPQPVSEKTTAILDKMYNIKKYNAPTSEKPTVPNARLSKYNYLTQVFSQMRASYVDEGSTQLQESPQSPQSQQQPSQQLQIHTIHNPQGPPTSHSSVAQTTATMSPLQPPQIAVYNEYDERKQVIDPYWSSLVSLESATKQPIHDSPSSTNTNGIGGSLIHSASPQPLIPVAKKQTHASKHYNYI